MYKFLLHHVLNAYSPTIGRFGYSVTLIMQNAPTESHPAGAHL
jgi:hypothetical protein